MNTRRINRGNRYPNGSKCTTALKLLEEKKKRLAAQKRIKEQS